MKIGMKETEVLIIGAGPAGAVAAGILHKLGRSIVVLEKSNFPRFVIGESLLPCCMEGLDDAGFIPELKKAGFQLKNGAYFEDGERRCEFDFSTKFTDGWSWTWEVKRDKFDKILTDELINRGVDLNFGCTVANVIIHDDGTSVTKYTDASGTEHELAAKFIIDASGYGRVLPNLLGTDRPSALPGKTALFGHVKPAKPILGDERNKIIISSHQNNVWAWEIPFSDDTASVGFVGADVSLEGIEDQNELYSAWLKIASRYYDRYNDTEILFEPREIKNYSTESSDLYGNGYALVGNSFGFVDPIFSSGVTVATETSRLAAKMVHKHLDGEKVNWQKDYAEHLNAGVEVFKAFVGYWYDGTLRKIFFTSEENPELKRQICSILAGYVWDRHNSLVRKPHRIPTLAHVLESNARRESNSN